MAIITICLKPTEKDALRTLAEQEYRDPRAQAALIIRAELQRRGLLEVQPPPALQTLDLSNNNVFDGVSDDELRGAVRGFERCG
jgi:hypothetical protein